MESVSVAHCNLSAKVTPAEEELVILIVLKTPPPEVTVWPAEPLKVIVPPEGVNVPVLVKLPPTLAVLAPVEIEPDTFRLP